MGSPADLISLAQVQAYIGPTATGNDVKIGQLITAVSMAIRRMTDCVILPASFTETYDASPLGIMLRNWPVISIASVTVQPFGFWGSSGGTLLPAAVNGLPGYVFDLPGDPQASTPQLLTTPNGGFYKGQSVTITYQAGYQVTGEPATVSPTGGNVSAMAPYGAWGSDQGVTYASGAALQAVPAGSEAKGAYSVAAGTYAFSQADAGAAVSISYGYVPADIANAAMEWIADRIAYQDRIGVASKSIGGQETVSYRIGATPAFVTSLLQPFTNVVPI